MKSCAKTRRLFFALWPPDQVGRSILKQYSQLPTHIKGRAMQAHDLHVTLFFLGQVEEQVKDCMHQVAQTTIAEVFQLDLDCYGYFSRPRVFWMGTRLIPDELTLLHSALGAAIDNCGFKHESRPYVPHLTLMKKCSKPEIPDEHVDFSLPWQVEGFALVESIFTEKGVNYQVIEKYPLS